MGLSNRFSPWLESGGNSSCPFLFFFSHLCISPTLLPSVVIFRSILVFQSLSPNCREEKERISNFPQRQRGRGKSINPIFNVYCNWPS
ncbi:hypothetical protein LguiA_032997 [Lonicera macranthoides]